MERSRCGYNHWLDMLFEEAKEGSIEQKENYLENAKDLLEKVFLEKRIKFEVKEDIATIEKLLAKQLAKSK